MGFEPLGKTIKSLINSHVTFEIPRFQRDFSWDTANYEEFYKDIINQLKYVDNKFSIDKYFLGNMIFLGEKNSEIVDVIDGQQRLTTITIILAALRDRLKKISSDEANSIANTIQEEYILKKMDGETNRRLETKTSFPYFANTIQDSSGNVDKPTSDEEEDLMKTFENFKKKLDFDHLKKDFYKNKGINIIKDEYTEILKAIRDQILGCEVVAIYVDDKIQANKIFENINSKGKPLSQVDLVKNYIFNKLPPNEANVDNISLKWMEMKKNYLLLEVIQQIIQ